MTETQKVKSKPDDSEQPKRFTDMAYELGANETGSLFEKAIERIEPTKNQTASFVERKTINDSLPR